MAVFADHCVGTIGGGQLEYGAIRHARELLQQAGQVQPLVQRYRLGASMGQCCGGDIELQYCPVTVSDADSLRKRLTSPTTAVALFGAGHVGRAVVTVLALLPVTVLWIDSRDAIFPSELPGNVRAEPSDPAHAAVAGLSSGSSVLVMSHSHTQDLDIIAGCLTRQRGSGDLPYLGLIGSRTKWASFRQRLLARGFTPEELAHVTCPIGVPGISDKRPEAIAVAVAAQLLQDR
jgi:xanthine dehydrogenase accessory factor